MCHMTEYAAAQTRKYEWFSLIAKTACVAKENKHNSHHLEWKHAWLLVIKTQFASHYALR